MKAQQELIKLATGYDCGTLDAYSVRMTFHQLQGFMEEHMRKGLKQVSQVWVQVTVLKSELAKLKPNLDGKNGILDFDLEAAAESQVTYLKKQLEHEEVKTRLEDNSRNVGQLRMKLETQRRRANKLEDENKKARTYLEELKSQALVLDGELNKLSDTSTRINNHLDQQDYRIRKRIEAMNKEKRQKIEKTEAGCDIS
ncbi:hypothetical protein SK128_006818 [Halocaridina rubra]|uniref:Uncharacterized protein n=1 Tax=Halocaridina rubra TaxID=373956 RepID=A0AAN8WT89_HALRR